MAAYGPDFKKQFVDHAPISNSDIQPTLAKILRLKIASNGKLNGRVLEEALLDGPSSVPFKQHVEIATPQPMENNCLDLPASDEASLL